MFTQHACSLTLIFHCKPAMYIFRSDLKLVPLPSKQRNHFFFKSLISELKSGYYSLSSYQSSGFHYTSGGEPMARDAEKVRHPCIIPKVVQYLQGYNP